MSIYNGTWINIPNGDGVMGYPCSEVSSSTTFGLMFNTTVFAPYNMFNNSYDVVRGAGSTQYCYPNITNGASSSTAGSPIILGQYFL